MEVNWGGRRGARKLIMATAILQMLCYLIMWIIMPTNLYSFTWTPIFITKLNSTSFGTQGPSILIFTFPIIFIAVLGIGVPSFGKAGS